LNGNTSSINELVNGINSGSKPSKEVVEILVAPPTVYLQSVKSKVHEDVLVAAQNCYKKETGAFTGEISPTMLKDIGINWVILGHSERRSIFKETNEEVGEKTHAALKSDVNVVFCVGEQLDERKANKTEEVVFAQLAPIKDVKKWESIVIAYEPVWAIGTGVVASPDQAQDTQHAIRKWFSDNVSKDVADRIRIIYGGSVKPDNAEELAKKPDVDGFLVGGASLVASDFLKIVSAAQAKQNK